MDRRNKWNKSIVDRLTSVSKQLVVMAFVCLLVLSVPAAMAQFTGTFEDDFEDGNIDGWASPNPSMQHSSESIEGSGSIYLDERSLDITEPDYAIWEDGPSLELQEGFTIEGTFRPNEIDSGNTIRIGIIDEQGQQGENAFLIFDDPNDRTFLSTFSSGTPESPSASISDSFNNEWVHFKMNSTEGDDTLRAKVWNASQSEPSSYQMSVDGLDGVNGEFSYSVGSASDDGREAWLDSVTIQGSTATPDSDTLDLDAEKYMEHGTIQDYYVYATVNDTEGPGNTTIDVTEQADLTSSDTDVVTVDESTQTLNATDNESINERVTITANYEDETTTVNVTVANATVDNLDILPTWTRVSASLDDETLQLIIVSTMIGAGAAIFAGSFAGLTAATGITVLGWFAGMASDGILIVAFLMAIFIGLNLAGNINMQVRQ